MTQETLVSIVLPTYNGARYLAESVQSVIDQMYQNWELVIVDDASTDKTPEIIAVYKEQDQRIRSFRHQENQRLPGALNTGFNNARGEYLSWTSDDNIYHPDALKEMVGLLEKNPEVHFVYTDYNLIDEEGEIIEEIPVEDPEVLGLQDAIGGCFLYRRIVHETLGGYDETLFLAEDLDFWLRAHINFKLQPLHINLYSYRDHPGSLTQSKSRQVYLAHEQVLGRHLPKMIWMSDDIRAHIFLRLAGIAFSNRDMASVFRLMSKALAFSPSFVFKKAFTKLMKGTQTVSSQ